ncbi:MAG: hypothetical protein ACO3MB_06490 [Saprospiraceae bacterium]|jgi:hypothetical protein
MSKPRVIKEFDKLEENIQQAVFQKYPYGFDRHIITFKNHKNQLLSALPFETDDRYYMIKMTRAEANEIAQAWDDDDTDNDDNSLDEIEEITGDEDIDDDDD